MTGPATREGQVWPHDTEDITLYEGLFKHLLFPAYETVVRRRSTANYVAQYEASQWLGTDALADLQL